MTPEEAEKYAEEVVNPLKDEAESLHETMLSNAEEYGERLQEILETSITIANREMEKAIYGQEDTLD